MWIGRQRCNGKKRDTKASDDRIILKHFFNNISNIPNIEQIAELQTKTSFSEKQISKWFINERYRMKKKH